MPQPSSGAARHRWFLGVLVALTGAAVLVRWMSESPFASLIGFTILSFAALVWLIVGPSWMLAGAPARDADVTATARRFGRRVMWLVVLSRVVLEAIWWIVTGAPNDEGLFHDFAKTALSTLVTAYVAGRMAQYMWLRRPPDAATPWLLGVWPL
jgi:hypothetical protein